MRVRVTNFTSLVATVDFPLVLISGCVDNYSDQVGLLFWPQALSSAELDFSVDGQRVTELKIRHHALMAETAKSFCALDYFKWLDTFHQQVFVDQNQTSV